MFLEIQVSSSRSSLCRWYLPVVFTAMNRSSGERRSTGAGGALLRAGPLIALLSRVSFLKYAEKTFPPGAATVGSTGSPLLGWPTVTTSMPVTSRQVTAAAAARGAAAELKVIIDPPAGFHIVTERVVLQLRSWTEGRLRGLFTTSPQWTHNRRPISLRPSVDDDLLLFYSTEVINSSSGRGRARASQ